LSGEFEESPEDGKSERPEVVWGCVCSASGTEVHKGIQRFTEVMSGSREVRKSESGVGWCVVFIRNSSLSALVHAVAQRCTKEYKRFTEVKTGSREVRKSESGVGRRLGCGFHSKFGIRNSAFDIECPGVRNGP
jgi:hypothetical protein